MSLKCTAPVKGHRPGPAADQCPVHGKWAQKVNAARASAAPSPGWSSVAIEYGKRLRQAHDVKTSPEVLACLAQDEDAEIRIAVSWNGSASDETMLALARDDNSGVRYSVALAARATTEVLSVLAADDSEYNVGTHTAVASHHNVSPETLTLLAKSKQRAVRYAVAHSRKTPLSVLQAMTTKDRDKGVRDAAAQAVAARQES